MNAKSKKMKNTASYIKHSISIVLVLLLTVFSSCSDVENSDIKSNDDIVSDTPDDSAPPSEEPIEETPEVTEKNCDIDWNTLMVKDVLIVDCLYDLNNETIRIPRGVLIKHEEGGEIINGTFEFEGINGIAGALLHHTLTLSGEVTLLNNIFEFIPEKWNITEGVVDDLVARENRDILENAMIFTQNMGAERFIIDRMDAFFNVDEPETLRPSTAAINVPSNFTLQMSDNTHLRMQPNAAIRPTLLATHLGENILIDGGILHGDRDQHDYSSGGTHEWGHLLRISGTKNSVFRNMTFMDATGDGVDVHAIGHSFDPFYAYCDNVVIEKNTFIRNRRNQISITDGRNIIVDKNEFIDASIHTEKSRGIAPGFGIDVEAVRFGNPRGISEIAEDITIKNNTERGSRVGAVTVHTGDRVTIENNTFENSISYSTSIGTIIRNNEITGKTPKNTDRGIAIVAGRSDVYDKNYDGRVYGNTINNYSIGMVLTNKDLEAYDNQIIDCKVGINIATIRNSKIYNNTVKSSRENSDGIVSHPTIEYMDNVYVGLENKGNIVDVTRTPLKFVNVNTGTDQTDFKLMINYNTINSTSTCTFANSHGFDASNNTIREGGFRLSEVERANFTENKITSTVANGIRIDAGCSNLLISKNTIKVTGRNLECIKENTSDGINITITDNSCN